MVSVELTFRSFSTLISRSLQLPTDFVAGVKFSLKYRIQLYKTLDSEFSVAIVPLSLNNYPIMSKLCPHWVVTENISSPPCLRQEQLLGGKMFYTSQSRMIFE